MTFVRRITGAEFIRLFTDSEWKALVESTDVDVMRYRDYFLNLEKVAIGSNELKRFMIRLEGASPQLITAARGQAILAGEK